MRERETKFSPRVLLRIFHTQRSLRARREIHHTNPHVFFIRPKIFPPKLRLEKSRKVNNNAGEEFKTFSFITWTPQQFARERRNVHTIMEYVVTPNTRRRNTNASTPEVSFSSSENTNIKKNNNNVTQHSRAFLSLIHI